MVYFYIGFALSVIAFLGQIMVRKERGTIFFCVLSFAGFVVARIPSIYYPQSLCIDEAEWLALVSRLGDCNIPYQCYNASTSGFLSIAVLQIFHWTDLQLNYIHLRILGLLISGVFTAYFYYGAICIFYGKKTGKILVSLLFVYFTLGFHDREFLAYNTEYLVMLFTAILYYLYANLLKSKTRKSVHWVLSGLIIGVMPFFKLQAIPIAFVFFVLIAIFLWKYQRKSEVLLLILVCTLPGTVFLLSFAGLGLLTDFYRMYVESNLYYISHRITTYKYSNSEFIHKLRAFKGMQEYFYPVYIAAFLFFGFGFWKHKSFQVIKQRLDFILIWFFAAYATYNTGNGFGHYNVLMVLPVFFIVAAIWESSLAGAEKKMMPYTVGAALFVFSFLIYIPKAEKGIFDYPRALDTENAPRVKYIQTNSTAEDAVCSLGWVSALEFQLLTERKIATRCATEQYISIGDSLLREYFQKQYISDLHKTQPKFIVDCEAVLPRPSMAKIREYVYSHYYRDTTLGGYEFFRIK